MGIGCAATLNFQKRLQAGESLKKGEKFIIKREYKEALIEYKKVLRLFPKVSPGDNALFHIGIIWLHPDNPQRAYEKSLISFQRVIHDFSQTRLREKAKMLSCAVNKLIRSENDIKKLKESVDSLQNRLRTGNKGQTKTLKKQIEEIGELKGQIQELKGQIGELKGQIQELKGQLRELKEIDIVIEEKKRGRE